ncbi:MAG: winged helix-turn-helix transcriptional regulator [Gluconacetobacter diazotrophicus]|nr:winged helix-turn-helix transcriptional regulator [Gluconacetobacter diazotrophicus]
MPDCRPPCTRSAASAGVHVWLVLLKAHQAIGRVAEKIFRHSCLGESEFRVLEVLLHKGPLPVNVIGPKVFLTPGSISVAVDRLHGRGLVTRAEDPDDRRVRVVDLTAEGRCLITRVFRQHAADMEEVVRVLTPEERDQLVALLKKVGRHAEALGKDQPEAGRTCA